MDYTCAFLNGILKHTRYHEKSHMSDFWNGRTVKLVQKKKLPGEKAQYILLNPTYSLHFPHLGV